MFRNIINRFSVFDLTIMALMAVLGIAVKPIILPLVQLITAPLFIPGGAVAGGFYMIWIILPRFIVRKHFTATITCVIQALLVMSLGIIGSHGIMSILTYVLPGVAVDLFLLITYRNEKPHLFHLFFAGILANLMGSIGVNFIFFRLPLLPLLIALTAGAISGGLGGLIAYNIYKQLSKTPLFSDFQH